jgi:hypothetical protein
MLRPLTVVAAAAAIVLTSCGDDNNTPAPAPAPQQGVSGSFGGQPFTAADASALTLTQGTCSFDGTTATATGVLLGFGTFSGLCSLVTQTQGCGTKASATIVTALVVRANVAGGTPGAVQPGTFTIGATAVPDAQGNVTVVDALATRTDATCGEPAAVPGVTGGTVTLTAIGARVTGSIDLTFSDGGRVTGSFDVPECGFQTDVCTLIDPASCTSSPCIP